MTNIAVSGGNQCTEVQFKMTMIMPTKIYATKRDLEKFFEETIALELANIHYENIEIEAIGRTSGFTYDEGTIQTRNFYIWLLIKQFRNREKV